MTKKRTGNEIRQTFIDFFSEHGHTFVPSISLVPGGDATLLFTNSGMVQFKDVFLGTDKRPYTRAVNSQKCMRVAGSRGLSQLESLWMGSVSRKLVHYSDCSVLVVKGPGKE